MRIATRTPEGQPLECRVCGKITFVLVSDPPGDAVCPICGCHAWLVPTRDQQTLAIVAVADDISNLVSRLRRCESRFFVAATLADGLRGILAPDGIVVWGRDERFANADRMTRLASRGGNGDLGFACEVVTQRRSLIRRSVMPSEQQLVFGAPMAPGPSRRPVGAIEVRYEREISPDSEDTVSRVISSLAVVASAKHAYSD